MRIRRGGYRYCPFCREILETRVLVGGYKHVVYHGIPVKRRKVICGMDREGRGGCGHEWFTYEIPETVLGDAFSGADSGSGGKRGRKRKRKILDV